MTDQDERDAIKRLTGEQLTKELEAFNAFHDQFGGKFLDAHASSYYNLLSAESANRAKLQRYSEREKGK